MMQHIEGILNVGSVKSLCELTGAIVPVIKHDMKHLEHLCFSAMTSHCHMLPKMLMKKCHLSLL